jgi:hypothetical protein
MPEAIFFFFIIGCFFIPRYFFKSSAFFLNIIPPLIYSFFLVLFSIIYQRESKRYSIIIITLLIWWISAGIYWLCSKLSIFLVKKNISSNVAKTIIFALIISSILWKTFNPARDEKAYEKEVGLEIKRTYTSAHKPKILTRLSRVAFYADGNLYSLSRVERYNLDKIIRMANSGKVDYFIIDKDIEEIFPDFWSETQKSAFTNKFSLISSLSRVVSKDKYILVYQVGK